MWVFSCISQHLGKAFCIVSCCDLFLCWHCSFLTCDNSLLFYFIRYIIGQLFCGCIECSCVCFLVSLCILVRLSASCHIVTCFFVVVFISHSSQLSFVLFHLIHYWQFFCVCIECLCVCFIVSLGIQVKLSASCHIMTCFFVDADAVDFSLVTTLFCFISLDTLLATFLFVLSVYVCVSLHFLRLPAWCHIDLFLCWCCWLLTRDNSLCFISLGTLLATFLWLYWVFMCVFTCISFGFLWGFLHHVTLQLVSLLMLLISHSWQLSLFYFIRYIIGGMQLFFVIVLSVYVCVYLHHCICLCKALCVMPHCNLFLCCCCCCSFSLMVLIKPVACHLIEVKGADRYTVTSVFNPLN